MSGTRSNNDHGSHTVEGKLPIQSCMSLLVKVPLLKTRIIHASFSGSARQLELATDQPETERLHISQHLCLSEAAVCLL